MANLRAALADIYPALRSIVGASFFDHAADEFARMHPSRSGDLNQFGREWPDFMATYAHAQELPYLADVARLEWAWHEAFHAAEHAPFDMARLAEVPSGQHGLLRFQLHSSVQLLASTFPLFRIWSVNQSDYVGSLDVDWSAGGDALLVQRQESEVVVRQLGAGAFSFLAALAAGTVLEQAAESALTADSGFDLQGFLVEFVQSGVIVDFNLEQQ